MSSQSITKPSPLVSTLSDSETSKNSVNPLLSLPTELFEAILDDVFNDQGAHSPYLASVCRRFSSVVRRKAFTSVQLNTNREVQRFFKCLVTLIGIAANVQRLKIRQDIHFTEDHCRRFLTVLTSLSQLEVRLNKVLASYILDPPLNVTPLPLPNSPIPTHLLPSLRKLEIHDGIPVGTNPLDPVTYINLGCYPRLFFFSLYLSRTQFQKGHAKELRRDSISPNSTISNLVLSPDISREFVPAVQHLLAHFRRVTCLYVNSELVFEILIDYPYPDHIRTLTFDIDTISVEELSDLLPRFPRLDRIILDRGACTGDKLVASSSAVPTLSRLAFYRSTRIDTISLRDFINDLIPPLTLTSISLDNVDFSSIDVDDMECGEWEEEGLKEGQGWNRDFNPRGLSEVLEVSDLVGVELKGVAVDAVRLWQRIERKREARRKKEEKEKEINKEQEEGGASLHS